jgi:hypothetical protein
MEGNDCLDAAFAGHAETNAIHRPFSSKRVIALRNFQD